MVIASQASLSGKGRNKNHLGAPAKLEPWSYQVDTLVPTMDLSAGRTWGQVVSVTSDGFARCKKPLDHLKL